MERKGASYKITEKRAANHHGEHTQRTNATAISEMYGGDGVRPSGVTGAGMTHHPRPEGIGVTRPSIGRERSMYWGDDD